MKLSDLKLNENAEAGAKMPILHPVTFEPMMKDDGKTPQTIMLCGIDSDRYKSADKAQKNKTLRSGRQGKVSVEKLQSNDLDILVACVMGWDIELFDDPEQNKFMAQNVRELLAANKFIYDQVNEYIADRTNFLKSA